MKRLKNTVFGMVSLAVMAVTAGASENVERSFVRRTNFKRIHGTDDRATLHGTAPFRPVARWSGRLLLPTGAERRGDGGVYLELGTWDERMLPAPAGSKPVVALRWPTMPFGARGFDVRFTERVHEVIGGTTPETASYPAPWRLDGMRRVSALESLAGHRPTDDVYVALKSVRVEADAAAPSGVALVIDQEPVQVPGSHVCLVSFVERVDEETLRAVPWKPAAGGFAGVAFDMRLPRDVPLTVNDDPERCIPQSSVEDIETSPLNADGWYAYGHLDGATFVLDGLEPRALMRLDATATVFGTKAGRRFVERTFWDVDTLAATQGRHRSVLVLPDRTRDDQAALRAMADHGSLLVVNLFGWWGRNGKAEREQALRTGHFALGFADVVRCPFTGEQRLSIEYKQIYGLNNEDIIAGSQSWAQYNGDLHRGWMYLRPNADVLVDLPEITRDYRLGDEVVSVREIVERNLEQVMAAYRVGAGSGVAVISELNSCSQDSTQALFLTFESIFDEEGPGAMVTQSFPAIAAFRLWAEDEGNAAPDARRWRRLRRLYGRPTSAGRPCLSGEFFRVPWTPVGERVWRKDWLVNLHEPSTFVTPEAGNNALSVLDAFASSRNSVLPRQAFDTLAKLLLEHEAPMVFKQTVQIGGSYDGLFPMSPEKVGWEKLRSLVVNGFGRLIGR